MSNYPPEPELASNEPIPVACGIIRDVRGLFLISQRTDKQTLPLKWQFPGGKKKPGETIHTCLERELLEELNLRVHLVDPEPYERHPITFDHGSFDLFYFFCFVSKPNLDKVLPLECNAIVLVQPWDLPSYDFLPMDKELAVRLARDFTVDGRTI